MTMMTQKRAIGTVSYMGGLPALLEPFCWSWGQLQTYNAEYIATPGTYVHATRAKVSDHAVARNGICEGFLGDWLVMLDTDHVFEPDIVARLVRSADAYGLDVLSGVYRAKGTPHAPVLYEWIDRPNGDGEQLNQILGWNMGPGFLEIGSAGGGCLFIRRSVLDAMRVAFPGEQPFDRITPYSEDHSFFIRCRKLGIKPFVATHILCDHLTIRAITAADAVVPTGDGGKVEVGGYGIGNGNGNATG